MLPAQKVYHELVNDSEGGPRHAVVTPRDPTQIKNFRKPLAAEARLSHDSIYYNNVYQLCENEQPQRGSQRFHQTCISLS